MSKAKKKLSDFIPKCLWGFPVAEKDETGGRAYKPKKRKGIALLITVLAVAMIMIFTANMIINSQVNLEVSMKIRDNLKAEYMAKSGYNLALFLLSADLGLNLFMVMSKMETGLTDGTSDIWSMLNGLPIGGETIEMLTATQEAFDLSKVNDDDTLDLLKLFDGQFVLEVEDENSRINVNDCYQNRCSKTMAMLEAMMSCPAEKAFLEKKNVNGAELAAKIKDWIDEKKDAEPKSNLTDEDEIYRKKTPPYVAKNAPMYSVDELKLIDGWDEDIHNVFSPYITVYPAIASANNETKININSAKMEFLGCLGGVTPDCRQKFETKIRERDETGTVDGSLKQILSDAGCTQLGVDDANKVGDESFAKFSTVFRINASGQVGTQEKKITSVIQRKKPDKAKKIERSYDILYWHLL